MCQTCHTTTCPGCLPACDDCGAETHARYDEFERRLICDECRAPEPPAVPPTASLERLVAACDAALAAVTEACKDCGARVRAVSRCGLCPACAANDAAADAACIVSLRAEIAKRATYTPSATTLRRRLRDQQDRDAAVRTAAMLARLPAVNDRSRGAA